MLLLSCTVIFIDGNVGIPILHINFCPVHMMKEHNYNSLIPECEQDCIYLSQPDSTFRSIRNWCEM